MSKVKLEEIILEERKVKALEKISNTLDALVMWIEEIDKEEWNERIQYYLAEFLANTSQPTKGSSKKNGKT